jgi:hypothetical protein
LWTNTDPNSHTYSNTNTDPNSHTYSDTNPNTNTYPSTYNLLRMLQ